MRGVRGKEATVSTGGEEEARARAMTKRNCAARRGPAPTTAGAFAGTADHATTLASSARGRVDSAGRRFLAGSETRGVRALGASCQICPGALGRGDGMHAR